MRSRRWQPLDCLRGERDGLAIGWGVIERALVLAVRWHGWVLSVEETRTVPQLVHELDGLGGYVCELDGSDGYVWPISSELDGSGGCVYSDRCGSTA